MELDTSMHPTPSGWAVAKLISLLHLTTSIQCHCGQLAPIASICSFPLHHAFNIYLSHFPFYFQDSFPSLHFHRFTEMLCDKGFALRGGGHLWQCRDL